MSLLSLSNPPRVEGNNMDPVSSALKSDVHIPRFLDTLTFSMYERAGYTVVQNNM
jgi:hypothetical protein